MMQLLRISIITTIDRNDALARVRETISSSGGWIVDHTLFSNRMANINFELPQKRIAELFERLEDAGFRPVSDTDLQTKHAKDIRGQLSLTFVHDGPDLKRDVPSFG